jgi:predicted transcriptional regulator
VQIAEAERTLLSAQAQQRDVERAQKELDQQRSFLSKIHSAMSDSQRQQVQRIVDTSSPRQPTPKGPR